MVTHRPDRSTYYYVVLVIEIPASIASFVSEQGTRQGQGKKSDHDAVITVLILAVLVLYHRLSLFVSCLGSGIHHINISESPRSTYQMTDDTQSSVL